MKYRNQTTGMVVERDDNGLDGIARWTRLSEDEAAAVAAPEADKPAEVEDVQIPVGADGEPLPYPSEDEDVVTPPAEDAPAEKPAKKSTAKKA